MVGLFVDDNMSLQNPSGRLVLSRRPDIRPIVGLIWFLLGASAVSGVIYSRMLTLGGLLGAALGLVFVGLGFMFFTHIPLRVAVDLSSLECILYYGILLPFWWRKRSLNPGCRVVIRREWVWYKARGFWWYSLELLFDGKNSICLRDADEPRKLEPLVERLTPYFGPPAYCTISGGPRRDPR